MEVLHCTNGDENVILDLRKLFFDQCVQLFNLC